MTDETIYDEQKLADEIASVLSNGNQLIQEAVEAYIADYDVDQLISECKTYDIDYSHCVKEE